MYTFKHFYQKDVFSEMSQPFFDKVLKFNVFRIF